MATTFKNLLSTDIATTRTLLHEAIPLTGTIVSGTYGDENIKYYSHDIFESVYDYPYLSSSANRIFDLSYGYSTHHSFSANLQNTQKVNIYNEMALVLVGTDDTGSILKFDKDGDLTSGDKLNACIFIPYARLLTKDEIRKGTYTLLLTGTDVTVGDYGAATDYRTNSPAGEYGILYTSSLAEAGSGVGLLYYQAGIAVLTSSTDLLSNALSYLTDQSITGACNDLRSAWSDNNFQNTTELNSTLYMCNAGLGEFNYSTNPTYLSSSQMRVKPESEPGADSIAYITTIGLYSADNELLAVAKLSQPIKKDPTNSLTFRVRLDY